MTLTEAGRSLQHGAVHVFYDRSKGLSTVGVQRLEYENLFRDRPDPEDNFGHFGGPATSTSVPSG